MKWFDHQEHLAVLRFEDPKIPLTRDIRDISVGRREDSSYKIEIATAPDRRTRSRKVSFDQRFPTLASAKRAAEALVKIDYDPLVPKHERVEIGDFHPVNTDPIPRSKGFEYID